jgi:hypothetical protein
VTAHHSQRVLESTVCVKRPLLSVRRRGAGRVKVICRPQEPFVAYSSVPLRRLHDIAARRKPPEVMRCYTVVRSVPRQRCLRNARAIRSGTAYMGVGQFEVDSYIASCADGRAAIGFVSQWFWRSDGRIGATVENVCSATRALSSLSQLHE